MIALAVGQRPPLAPILRISGGILIGDLALRQALQSDAEARGVHHDEHRLEALFGLADQPALRAVVIHHAGGIAVNAHLLLERAAAEAVAVAEAAVLVDEELGHHEQRDALDVVGRTGALGEHEVDDVFRQVMLARRDEDLGAGD